MPNRRFRETPDLLAKIVDLEKRLSTLESARRVGNASIDAGQLTVSDGKIVVLSNDGHESVIVDGGSLPSYKMIPSSAPDSYQIAQYGWAPYVGGAAYEVHVEDHTGTRDGSKLLLTQGAAYMSHQPASGAEAFVACGDLGLGTEHFRLRGRWVYNNGYDEQDAVVFGYDSFGAGFSAAAYAFPYTFDQIPIVLCNIYNSGTAVAWDLSALSTSGFTVTWATGTTAKTVMWAAFRR